MLGPWDRPRILVLIHHTKHLEADQFELVKIAIR